MERKEEEQERKRGEEEEGLISTELGKLHQSGVIIGITPAYNVDRLSKS
jgi:hypothetical protein